MMTRVMILAVSVLSIGGCSTVSKIDEVATKAREYLAQTEAKVAEVKAWTEERVAAAEADRARFEAVTGAWDTDGDGRVTRDEAMALVKDTAKGAIVDGEKRSMLFDTEFWSAIGVALAGGWVGLKGAKKGVGALHTAGRKALGEDATKAS